VKGKSDKYNYPKLYNMVQKIKKLYDLSIKQKDEIVVPIKKIFLYPIRGIKGLEMEWCEVTPFGLKLDRIWCVMRESKMKPISNHNSNIPCFLRMEYDPDNKPNELVLKLKDDKCYPKLKKRSHTLLFEEDMSEFEFIEG